MKVLNIYNSIINKEKGKVMKLLILSVLFLGASVFAEVSSLRVPDGGISPQCVTDSTGTTHMVYYKGDPRNGDIFYTSIKKGSKDFASSVRVNSQAGSAVAMGTIRAAHLAIGKDNSVHVVWNGSQKAQGQLLYSRSLDGQKFTAQKDMKGSTAHMDGGGSVAANDSGNVYVVWHGNKSGTVGEENRRVFVAMSTTNGESFEAEKEASPDGLGICPCCSLKAYASGKDLMILFRGAKGPNRDIYELVSNDLGKTFKSKVVGKWRAQQCPMSSQALSTGKNGFLKAWESDGKIYFSNREGSSMAVPSKGPKKHPFIVENNSGNLLVVWTEGTGWNKGGNLCWQLISSGGMPKSRVEKVRGGVKVWSTVSAFSDGDNFYIVH